MRFTSTNAVGWRTPARNWTRRSVPPARILRARIGLHEPDGVSDGARRLVSNRFHQKTIRQTAPRLPRLEPTAGHANANRMPAGTSSRTTAPAPTTARSPDADAVEDLGARADPRAVTDRSTPDDLRPCSRTGCDGIREIVIAADDVGVGRHQRIAGPMRDAARGEHLAVEADVRAVAKLDVAVLARQDRVAADEDAVADADAAIDSALRVEQAVVVDDDVVADVDLVRMAQDDVLAEDDVAAAGSRAATDTTSCAGPGRARRRAAGASVTIELVA